MEGDTLILLASPDVIRLCRATAEVTNIALALHLIVRSRASINKHLQSLKEECAGLALLFLAVETPRGFNMV